MVLHNYQIKTVMRHSVGFDGIGSGLHQILYSTSNFLCTKYLYLEDSTKFHVLTVDPLLFVTKFSQLYGFTWTNLLSLFLEEF